MAERGGARPAQPLCGAGRRRRACGGRAGGRRRAMTDYSEEQRNEVEALQSIYPDSFTGERRPPRLTPGTSRGRPRAAAAELGVSLPAPSVRASGPGVGAGESLRVCCVLAISPALPRFSMEFSRKPAAVLRGYLLKLREAVSGC